MKFKQNKKEGYILVLTMVVLAAIITLITYMFIRSSTYASYMHTMIQRQKAKQLTFGGVQVAIAQLAHPDEQEKDAKKKQTPDSASKLGEHEDESSIAITPDEQTKQFLARILPIINRWQIFELQEKIDGIDGTLKICLMCEQGKINLNKVYDFEKKSFMAKVLQLVIGKRF